MGRPQGDVARIAGVSGATVSRVESGLIAGVSVGTIQAIARVLGANLDVRVRWRGAALDRLVAVAHAELSETMTARLVALGWDVRPEISFAVAGERGIVDLLCWHPAARALLVVELKTRLVDVGELLGTLDRKARLARRIAARFQWSPTTLGVVLVISDDRTNRRHARRFQQTLAAALPADGRTVGGWLRRPDCDLVGRLFLTSVHPVQARRAARRSTARTKPSGRRG